MLLQPRHARRLRTEQVETTGDFCQVRKVLSSMFPVCCSFRQGIEHDDYYKFHLSGVVNRVAIWFYYRKAFATAFAVLSRAQFWLSRRDFFRNIFRGGFRGKYSS